MTEPIELLSQELVFAMPAEDGLTEEVEIRMDLLEAEIQLEDLYENGKRKETSDSLDYLRDVQAWVKKKYSVELTITQIWAMERRIRQAFEAYKKKADGSPEWGTTTDSTSSG